VADAEGSGSVGKFQSDVPCTWLFQGRDAGRHLRDGSFEDVAFGGDITRRNLTSILRAACLLTEQETVGDKIRSTETEFHFGSLVRCSLSRYDEKNRKNAINLSMRHQAPLVTRSFSEIPQIVARCTNTFLAQLPNSIKAMIVLGVTDSYVRSVRKRMQQLHPEGFRQINQVAYQNSRMLWVHLTHPSRGNGTLNCVAYAGHRRHIGSKEGARGRRTP
jgi:hypothetical protein